MVELAPWPEVAAISLVRVLLAGALIYVGLPWLMLPHRLDPESSPWVARGIWMAFANTVLVHVLAVSHIYEALVVVTLCLGFALWTRVFSLPEHRRISLQGQVLGGLYDLIDGRRQILPRMGSLFFRPGAPLDPWRLVALASLLTGLAIAAYLLFKQSFTVPMPPFSDAPVNIDWLKHMENGHIYKGAVYPRGMYATLSLLRKFTSINAVPLLGVAGPLLGFFILLSVLFFVYRTTRSRSAVVVALILYGLLPHLLPMEFSRHASPNSQEYGLIFVLPAVWFTYSYLQDGRWADRATAAAAAGVAAFTHPVPTLFVVPAMGAAGMVALLTGGRQAWRRLPGLILWVGAAGVVAVVPLATALLAGQKWHGSSLEYASQAVGSLPPVNPMQVGALGGLGAVSLALVLFARRAGARGLALAAGAATGAVALGIALLPSLVNSQALADRSREYGAMGLVIAAAVAWSLLERLLGRLGPASVVAVALTGAVAVYRFPPTPAQPYLYYTPDMIQLYLEADETFRGGSWTIVTDFRGYALALGRALHLYPDEFIAMAGYMPDSIDNWYQSEYVTLQGQAATNETEHFVFMVERAAPLAPDQPLAAAEPVLQSSQRLAEWLEAHRDKLPLRHIRSTPSLDAWVLDLPIPKRPSIFTPAPQPSGPLGR